MHSYLFAAGMAAALLFGAPWAGKSAAHLLDQVGIFDPLTCAMSVSGPCSRPQMIEHRRELMLAAAGG